MNIKPFAAALLLSFPTACQSTDKVVNLGGPDACGAQALQYLIGQDKSVVQTLQFSDPVRVLNPGDIMTMDFNPHRLNIMLDNAGIITEVRCG
ncbi:MAG: I78 family peptidase inhibitor [Paracoccaceae bacterium]